LSGGDQPVVAAAPAAKWAAPEPEPETPVEESAAEDGEIPKPVAAPVASPSVRRLARELRIDLSKVRGSEAGGRIVTGDIRAYIARLQKVTDKPKAAASAPQNRPPNQLIFPNGGR